MKENTNNINKKKKTLKDFSVDEFIKYCNKIYYSNVNSMLNYLFLYIDECNKSNKIYSNDEISNLLNFEYSIEDMKELSNKTKDKISYKIICLILKSLDKNLYNKFIKLSKNIDGMSYNDICFYLDVIINKVNYMGNFCYLDKILDKYFSDINFSNNPIKFKNTKNKALIKYMEENSFTNNLNRLLKCLKMNSIDLDLVYTILGLLKVDSKTKLKNADFKLIQDIQDIIHKDISNKIKSEYDMKNFLESFSSVMNKVMKNRSKTENFKFKFLTREIELSNDGANKLVPTLNLNLDKLEVVEDENIIAIDDIYTLDPDGAFSIKKTNDCYILNVYIADVPSLLEDNPLIAKYAYDRATSLYIRKKTMGNYIIDMLPPYIRTYLALDERNLKNAIAFNYVFGLNGEIYSESVSRKIIRVTNSVTPKHVKNILKSNATTKIAKDLRIYKELIETLSKNSNNKYIKELSTKRIDDLVGFVSIYTNYYIGRTSDFAIYRDNGEYTIESSDMYTHSVTPIRKIVSDINLAYFLNQYGIKNFNEKMLYRLQDNIDEILEHLNQKEEMAKFVNNNSSFISKIYKF